MLYNFKNYFNKSELSILMDFLISCESWHFKRNIHQKYLNKNDHENFTLLFNQLFLNSVNYNSLIAVVNDYFNKQLQPYKDIPTSPIRYPDGQRLSIHSDSSSYNLEIDDFITFVFYLNDDYECGNLFYIYDDTEIDVDTQKGDLVILTPDVLHGTRNVQGGEKYVSVSLVEI